jgi:hypothetical protein
MPFPLSRQTAEHLHTASKIIFFLKGKEAWIIIYLKYSDGTDCDEWSTFRLQRI